MLAIPSQDDILKIARIALSIVLGFSVMHRMRMHSRSWPSMDTRTPETRELDYQRLVHFMKLDPWAPSSFLGPHVYQLHVLTG
ncbi:hypothetical protein BJX70DRAFT_364820 [Aspergillus crustosus]